jgi:hypothetical protein
MNRRFISFIASMLLVAAPLIGRAADVNLPAGSTLDATLQNEVNTKTAQDGQRFRMKTASGSIIYGHLSEVNAATPTRKAHVKFNFDLIQFDDGTRAPLSASLQGITQKKSINYATGAGEVLGGMILGNILGKKLGTNAGGLVGLAGGALLASNTAYNIDIPAGAAAKIVLTKSLVAGHPQAK